MLNIKKSLLAGSAVLAMGISTASLAAYGLPEAPAPVYNWYVGGFGGITYTPDADGINFDNPNWNIGAHFGYRWDPVRLEGEYMYQRSELEGPFIAPRGFNANDVDGHVNVHAALFNVLYDINIDSSIVPYVGFGIGYANVDATVSATFTDNNNITRTFSASSDSVSRFGYQALVGFGYKVWDNANLTVGYRYFGTTHCADAGVFNDVRFSNHKFDIGFDYYFM